MRVGLSFCVACVFLMSAGNALAQCRVEGSAKAADGSPLAGAVVLLRAPGLNGPLSATTDTDGRFAIDAVKAGSRVRISVTRDGRVVAEAFTLVTNWVEKVDLLERSLIAGLDNREGVLAGSGPAGEITGFVRTAGGQPLASVRVTIADTSLAALTDPAGRFMFGGLRPNVAITVQAAAEGFEPVSEGIVVPRLGRLDVDLTLEEANPTTASSEGLGIVDTRAGTSRVVVRTQQTAGVPSLARHDPFRVSQFLPGMTGSLESSEALLAREGTPGGLLTTFDGMTLYHTDQGFATFGAINADAVRQVDVSTGPFRAADGGRLSGTLRFSGEPSIPTRPAASVGMSLLGADATFTAPIGRHASVSVAGRHSAPESLYNDALDLFAAAGASPVRDRPVRYSGGTFAVSPDSVFRDVNARFDVEPGPKDRVSVSLYDGRGRLNNSHDVAVPVVTTIVPSDEDVSLPSDALIQVGDIVAWESSAVGAVWRRQWAPAFSTKLSFGRSTYAGNSDRASILTSATTGRDYSFDARRGGSSAWSDSGEVSDTTVSLDTTVAIGFGHVLSFGGTTSSFDVGYALSREVSAPAPTGGAYSTRMAHLIDRSESGRVFTVFAEDAWRPTASLALSPGIRVTHFDLTGSTFGDPRLDVTYQLSSMVRLKGAWGVDHQVVGRVTHEDLAEGDRGFWALADGTTVPVARTQHVAAGGTVAASGFLLDVEAYYKTLDDLTIFAPRLVAGAVPAATNPMYHRGSGTAVGVEAMLQHTYRWNTFWASYASRRTEYTYPTLEVDTFVAPHNRTHEVSIVDAVRIGARWTVSGSWTASTGRPFTPPTSVEQAWFPNGMAVYRVMFGAKNSDRLPAYHRLDVSTQWQFQFRRLKSAVGATVFNVYNRENVWFREYQTVGPSATVDNIMLMGRAANVYIRFGF
jgi:hypothetical protein